MSRSEALLARLEEICTNVFVNVDPIQSFSTNVCGDYCILFTHLRFNGYSHEDIVSSLILLDDDAHIRDHIVRRAVCFNLGVTLPAGGVGLDRVHIA